MCLFNKLRAPFQAKKCLLCLGSTHGLLPLCAPCTADLPYLDQCCILCALPLSDPINNPLCGNCLHEPPQQERTLCLFRYEAPIDQMISQLKFKGQLSYSHVLGTLFAQKLGKYYQENPQQRPEAILTVPLSRKRLAERGFNQAEQLARPLSQQLALPILHGVCERIIETRPQLGLPAKVRHKNLHRAFRVKKTPTLQNKELRHIALFDDVITTGATLKALTQELKHSGIEHVTLWSIARTPFKT